jgi:hypothetical protein
MRAVNKPARREEAEMNLAGEHAFLCSGVGVRTIGDDEAWRY